MGSRIKTNWWLLLLVGIIFIILSVKVMMHPVESIVGLAFFIGWASLISGVFQFGFAISSRAVINNWGLRMLSAIINIIIGLIFLTHPALTAVILPFLVGLWIIFTGISTIFLGIRLQSVNVAGGWFDIIIGILLTAGGVFIGYYPAAEAAMLVWLISLAMMVYGIYFVVISLQLSKLK